jgi:hypothetical protein
MKKMTLTLFAIAALTLAGGRMLAHTITVNSSNSGSVLQADDDSTTSDPAGGPDVPNGPDGGPDGTDQQGGPGAA